MTETRRAIAELAHIAAQTLPIWRDAAIVLLALVIIGCLWLAAAVYGTTDG